LVAAQWPRIATLLGIGSDPAVIAAGVSEGDAALADGHPEAYATAIEAYGRALAAGGAQDPELLASLARASALAAQAQIDAGSPADAITTLVADALAALFPGGTITGAPKIRAMEVIAELEPVARGVYTGGLGWMGPDGAQFNILIRSAACRGGVTALHAGAGIVWDSEPAREWRESLRKAAALRVALGAES